MSTRLPYQGYPYTNPMVIDAPTIDEATAARWRDLPRRPIGVPVREQRIEDRVPEERTKEIKGNRDSVEPVIYIDIPEDGSSVSQSQQERGEDNPAFVEETIFYDPFEDRRIEMVPSPSSSDRVPGSPSTSTSSAERPPRPPPPRTLNLNLASPGPGPSSSVFTSPSSGQPGLPDYMSKETYVYGHQTSIDDGFLLNPIPVNEFPEPPPAYTEIEMEPPRPTSPPRTEVVVPPSPHMGKSLTCTHCGQRVNTLMVRETGAFTHVLACMCALLCLFPLSAVIYCTNYCKYKNHYCPNCKQIIGYEIPMLCQQMVYNKS